MTVNELLALFGAVATLITGAWALVKIVVTQFEKRLGERFDAQEVMRVEGRKLWEERVAKIEDRHGELERSFLKFLADLPKEYQRREDHVRFETVISAKLDALGTKFELFAERQGRG